MSETTPTPPIPPADPEHPPAIEDVAPEEPTPPRTEDLIRQVLDRAGATANRDVLLDLKITAAALKEMRAAFSMFRPLAATPKVTVFGSARVADHDPLYTQAHDLAQRLSSDGWMVVTGAGPGIMQAAAEGAGPDAAIGVSIRLPFEEKPSDILAGGDRVVAMKYFFTRKLMLIKESSGFVCLPGGFGTQDETFELLTLLQTGKTSPAPIVLLDVPGGTYWKRWADYVHDELEGAGLVSPSDRELYLVTDDVDAACHEIQRFWHAYHSLRWVGDRLVLRLHHVPDDAGLEALNERFGDLLLDGRIERSEPLRPEVSDRDHLDLGRLVMRYDPRRSGRLRALIDALNDLAPPGRGTATVRS
jgi:uncharacterized protein (TIGR00730 family)